MRIRWVTAGLAVVVGAMTFAACGDDSASSSEPAALTVVASEPAEGEYAFDMPAEMEGGTVTITLDNTGAEPHEVGFVQVEEGTDPQEFADQVLASERGCAIPDFVLNAPGGVGGAAPGADQGGHGRARGRHVRVLLHVRRRGRGFDPSLRGAACSAR